MALHPQFVTDKKGRRQGGLLTMKEYRELLESAQDVIDAALIDEMKNAPRVAWTAVKAKRMRRDRS